MERELFFCQQLHNPAELGNQKRNTPLSRTKKPGRVAARLI